MNDGCSKLSQDKEVGISQVTSHYGDKHDQDDNPFSVDEIEPRLYLGNQTCKLQTYQQLNWQ
jgi:hypothetical protein